MKNVKNSRHFMPYIDPDSKVTTYILKTKIAPIQQHMYFVNASMTNDCRYLWFTCAYPPMEHKTMAVLDFETDEITHLPDTRPGFLDEDTGILYYGARDSIYMRGPKADDKAIKIAKLPNEITKQGLLTKISSHLILSADKSELVTDIAIGNKVFLGSVDVNSGKFELWQQFDRGYNHAQFNPVDKDLILFAQDYYTELHTGKKGIIEKDTDGKLTRMFTIRRGEKAKLIQPMFVEASHEWWSADGKWIYYVDWIKGVVRINIKTDERQLVYEGRCRHAFATKDDKYITADDFLLDEKGEWHRGCETDVTFLNTITQKKIKVVTLNPALYTADDPCIYHIDAHPRFVGNDKYLNYTTTVRGKVDVAMAVTADLVKATKT